MRKYYYIVTKAGKIIRLEAAKVSSKDPVEGKNSISYTHGTVFTVPPEDWSHKLSVALDRAAEVCQARTRKGETAGRES